MTNKDHDDTKKAVRKTGKSAAKSKKSALALLKKMGMVDKNGKLTARYNHKEAA